VTVFGTVAPPSVERCYNLLPEDGVKEQRRKS